MKIKKIAKLISGGIITIDLLSSMGMGHSMDLIPHKARRVVSTQHVLTPCIQKRYHSSGLHDENGNPQKLSNVSNISNKKKDSPWAYMPSPSDAYKEYLNYAGERVVQGILHNLTLGHNKKKKKFSEPSLGQLKVLQTEAREFKPMPSSIEDLYCSKMTICHLNARVFVHFLNRLYYRTITIEEERYKHIEKHEDMENVMDGDIQYAYRNIVPDIFSITPNIAGPMGYHEFILDGSNYPAEQGELALFINPKTPVKINIQNCSGIWNIFGPESIKDKFLYNGSSCDGATNIYWWDLDKTTE